MGGHVRVGFEDNLNLLRGVKADSNARFVERIVELARLLGREWRLVRRPGRYSI
jgi:3-keto-5-aminohexanoate cleavage enzyme